MEELLTVKRQPTGNGRCNEGPLGRSQCGRVSIPGEFATVHWPRLPKLADSPIPRRTGRWHNGHLFLFLPPVAFGHQPAPIGHPRRPPCNAPRLVSHRLSDHHRYQSQTQMGPERHRTTRKFLPQPPASALTRRWQGRATITTSAAILSTSALLRRQGGMEIARAKPRSYVHRRFGLA